jgi:hypothetical protein
MNALPSSLRLYRADLVSAIQSELEAEQQRRGRRRHLLVVAASSSVAAAAAVVGAVLLFATTSVGGADAAVLTGVSRALTPPPGTILHEYAVSTANGRSVAFELWQSLASPDVYRVVKGTSESSSNGSLTDSFDESSGTIVRSTGSTRKGSPDPAAAIKAMIDAGEARVLGTAQVDGRAVWKLDAQSRTDRFLTGTLYVDRSTYYPVLIEVQNGYLCPNAACDAVPEQIRFRTYEYLPATAANTKLLSVSDQHPGARIVASDGATTTNVAK